MENQGFTTVVIEWRGPFTLEELKDEAGCGMYLLTGRKSYSRNSENELQYCGVTEQQFCKRVNPSHKKVQLIAESSLQIWLGRLMYPQEQMRKHLEDAEYALVSFWDIKMNEKKKSYYPDFSICIVSRWCRNNGNAYKRFPPELSFIRTLDDVLWWDKDEWRAGDLRIVKYDN